MSEGLTWQNIDYSDNSSCIQLISEKSVGFFDLLNQESKYVNVSFFLSFYINAQNGDLKLRHLLEKFDYVIVSELSMELVFTF